MKKKYEENAAIQILKQYLTNEITKFPKGFIRNLTRQDVIFMIQYFIEEYLKWDDEMVYKKLNRKVFQENGLLYFLNMHCKGSVYEALTLAYPKKYQKQDMCVLIDHARVTDHLEEKTIIAFLQKRLNNQIKRFPDNFFSSLTDEQIGMIIRYLVDEVFQWKHEEVCLKFTSKFLKDCGLSGLYGVCRKTVYDLLELAYPGQYLKREIYHWHYKSTPKKPTEILNEKLNGQIEALSIDYLRSLRRYEVVEMARYFVEDFLGLYQNTAKTKLTKKCFRQYGLETFLDYFFEGKVSIVLEWIYPGYSKTKAAQPMVYYNAVEVLQLRLEGKMKRFSKQFIKNLTKKDLKKMMLYFIKDFLQWDREKICQEFNTSIFMKNGIYGLLTRFFKGDPWEVLELVYPGEYQYKDLKTRISIKKCQNLSVLETFKLKVQGELFSFPKGYFKSISEEEKAQLIVYFVEEFLGWTPEEAFEKLELKCFREYGLVNFIKVVYGDCKNALQLTYPLSYQAYEENKKKLKYHFRQDFAQKVIQLLEYNERNHINMLSSSFFDELEDKEVAQILCYLVEEILQWEPENVKNLTPEILEQYHLSKLLESRCHNNMDEAITLAISEMNKRK